MRVAVVDMVRVLDDSKLGKAGAQQLQALYEQQQRELAPHQGKGAGTGGFAQQKLAERARQQEAEREKLRVTLREELLSKVRPIIADLAQRGGFDMVIGRPPSTLFVKPELELTDAVLTALDAL